MSRWSNRLAAEEARARRQAAHFRRTGVAGSLSRPPIRALRRPAAAIDGDPLLTGISAITLATHDMARAVTFYQALGFALRYGGPDARFTSFHVGGGYLNLIAMPAERTWSWWGRVI